MNRIDTGIPGVYLFEPTVHGDRRGFFMEFYNRRVFAEHGIDTVFVQDNHSSSRKHVVRGLHYQLGHPQAKLVRVIRGAVYDVAVDIRRGSPTFGQWVASTLSEENRRQLYVPEDFAHGFCVLSDMAEFEYKVSDYYAPEEERGIAWNDPDLDIPWPLEGAEPILSDRDKQHGTLATRPENDLPVYAE